MKASSVATAPQDIAEVTAGARRPEYGVILFDDARCTEGWAAIAGREAYRIASPSELGNDVIWLTSGSYEEMREAKLDMNPWLRNNGYIRINVKTALDDLGLKDIAGEQQDVAAGVLADAFSAVMAYAAEVVGIQDFDHKTLAQDMAELFPDPVLPIGEHEEPVSQALRECLQEWTSVPNRPPKGSVQVTLRRNRVDHALEMIQTPVPVDVSGLEFVRGSTMGDPKMRIDTLLTCGRPALAQVRITSSEQELAKILAFGNSMPGDGGKAKRRHWVSQPELAMLARYTDVIVDGAWIASEGSFGVQAPKLPDFWHQNICNYAGAASWAAGIVAENLWIGATKVPRKRKVVGAKGRAVSWRQVWLRASDRMRCFILAGHLHAAGYCVLSYGTGSLRVAVEPDHLPKLVQDAYQLGLVPPLTLLEIIPEHVEVPVLNPAAWQGGPVGAIEGLLRANGDRDLMSRIDQLPALGREKALRSLTDLLGGG